MAERSGTPIPQGVIARVTNGVRGMIAGIRGDTWFSPGQPQAPQEPQAQRRFAYQVGTNIQIQPRSNEGVSFAELRSLADTYSLVRLLIETRKEQIAALDFEIQTRGRKRGQTRKSKQIVEYLRYPDKQRTWSTWLKMLVEELLVLDAPCLYPRKTRKGELYTLDIVDGSTVKVLLDAQGRTPLPPSPAYQQVLYGIPAVDFTSEELVYMPRNPRANKVYGYSPVEQIIMDINIGIRRQLMQLQYYTDGNIPEAMIGCPTDWSVQMIDDFQVYFDALLSGDTANRRKAKFVPGGLKPEFAPHVELKDEYDEWLARVCCFAFSIPPTPFIKQMNRSTAEAAQETALQEGLAPLKQWVKELMDYLLAKYFDAPDLEFKWQSGEVEQDPLTRSQIDASDVAAGIKTINEVREERGLKAISEPQDGDEDEETEEENYSE